MIERRRCGTGARGPLGIRELLEPTIRQIVAARLNIPSSWLRPSVSFSQDLAATAIDLTRLVVAIERELDVHLDERVIDSVRTYGDLVDVVIAAGVARADPPRAVLLRTVLVPAHRDRHGIVVRAIRSSPYELDLLADDAWRAGPGSCLVLSMPTGAPADALALVERRLARLASRDVVVRVSHDDPSRRAVA